MERQDYVMDIKIFVHATDITGEIGITLEQIELLRQVGLLDVAKEVHICTHYNEDSYGELKSRLSYYDNIFYKNFDDDYRGWYEYTTCLELQKECNKTYDGFYALYLHNKGAYTRTIGNYNWRKYMQYFCVEKWKECVDKLEEGYDLVGAAYGGYFAGNFFWANSSYIQRCQQLKTPPEVEFRPQMEGQPHLRYDLEPWHASGNPKWYELHSGQHERWYLPPESYREDLKDTFIYNTI